MGWFKTNYDFGMSVAKFYFPVRSAAMIGQKIAHMTNDPEKIATLMEHLIVLAKPELHGGQVVFVDYEIPSMRFFACYYHPSLKRADLAADAPAEELPLPNLQEVL